VVAKVLPHRFALAPLVGGRAGGAQPREVFAQPGPRAPREGVVGVAHGPEHGEPRPRRQREYEPAQRVPDEQPQQIAATLSLTTMAVAPPRSLAAEREQQIEEFLEVPGAPVRVVARVEERLAGPDLPLRERDRVQLRVRLPPASR